MESTSFMRVDEVAQELGISKSYAYKIVKTLNKELAEQGYITMAGRVPRAYWEKKMYGYEQRYGRIHMKKNALAFLLILSLLLPAASGCRTDPSKSNAQAARCTGEITVNGCDRISSAP